MTQAGKTAPDWERIESEYRAGVLSVREIAASQGITHGAINKRAKRDGWERDLSAKIKAKADALVSKALVSTPVSRETAATERQIVEAGAEAIARVRMAHRTDISRSRALVMSLLAELETETGSIDLFHQLGEMMAKPDDRGFDKLNDLYRKVISLSGRVDNSKKLSEALKHLIGLEREAYGLDDAPSNAAPGAGLQVLMPLEEYERRARQLVQEI